MLLLTTKQSVGTRRIVESLDALDLPALGNVDNATINTQRDKAAALIAEFKSLHVDSYVLAQMVSSAYSRAHRRVGWGWLHDHPEDDQ